MACRNSIHVVEARETAEARDNSVSFLHAETVLKSAPATPDKRTRRKSMSRRSGQSGYIEKKGNAFYVRFWIDVPGQEKRAHKSIRICPISGPGKMTKPERERRRNARSQSATASSGLPRNSFWRSQAANAVWSGPNFPTVEQRTARSGGVLRLHGTGAICD